MALSERKEKIIQAVVDSYIDSCSPVSSSDIRDNYLPSLSSATIRNELAALEEMGYLAQPHTSAGRVPTADAYKLYVEKLMPRRELSAAELGIIRKYFDKTLTELDDVLRSTAHGISEITHLTGVAYIPDIGNAVVENVRIVRITERDALVIIVTNLGVLKDATLTVREEVPDDYFYTASRFITSAFKGHTIDEICSPDHIIEKVKDEFSVVFDTIVDILRDYSENAGREVVLSGGSKLLEQPEYADIGKAKAMMEMLESKESLYPVLGAKDGIGLNIEIRREDAESGNPECAVVTANLTTHGVNIGKAGVIGPIRMDYSKIVTVLDYIGKAINELPVGGVGSAAAINKDRSDHDEKRKDE